MLDNVIYFWYNYRQSKLANSIKEIATKPG